MGLLARNRQAFNDDTKDSDKRKFFSPVSFVQFSQTLPAALEAAHGDVLDVGAGDVPYRRHFEANPKIKSYRTADREERREGIDYVVDATALSTVVPQDAFDTVLLFEVLEHVPKPERVLEEIFAVLRPGGTLILSVPHLSRLHEQPYDFYRYTEFGLRHLMEETGFENVDVKARGGLASFLGHQVSTALVCSTWHLPVVREVAFALNKRLVVRPSVWLDDHIDRDDLFPLGYIAIAHKPNAERT